MALLACVAKFSFLLVAVAVVVVVRKVVCINNLHSYEGRKAVEE